MKVHHLLTRIPRWLWLWLTALAVIYAVLLIGEQHQLWKIQSMNLFLSTEHFFHERMEVSAGLLSYAGTFLTQFLFIPWVGLLILCACWLLLMWIVKKTFSIPDRHAVILLLPVVFLLIANMDMGYWIYTIKLRGFFFVATLGTMAVAALLWAFRSIPRKLFLPQILIVATGVIGYPLLGAYALFAIVVMALWSWRLETKKSGAVVNTLLALLTVVAVPLICYRQLYYITNFDSIYFTGLPVFSLQQHYNHYYVPYILLALFFMLLAVTYRLKREEGKGSVRRAAIIQGAWLAAMAAGVYLSWFKDENFHRELAMQHYVEQVQWKKILDEARQQNDTPTRVIVMLRNLALSRLGVQGEEMYNYKDGSKRYASPFPISASQIVGKVIYYHYGMLNECHRLCLEEGVEYGWRVETLQYLARSELLNFEHVAARRHADLLRKTLFYNKWVEHFIALINQPKLVVEALETGPVVHMLNYENTMGSDNAYSEQYLMNILSNSDSDEPAFQEQTLLAAMWKKDPKLFWPRFAHYGKLHPHDRIPRHYQEAAYMFGKLEGRQNIDSVPFNPNVKAAFNEFMTRLQQFDNQPLEEVQKAMYPQFGNTYFYHFFLTDDLKYF